MMSCLSAAKRLTFEGLPQKLCVHVPEWNSVGSLQFTAFCVAGRRGGATKLFRGRVTFCRWPVHCLGDLASSCIELSGYISVALAAGLKLGVLYRVAFFGGCFRLIWVIHGPVHERQPPPTPVGERHRALTTASPSGPAARLRGSQRTDLKDRFFGPRQARFDPLPPLEFQIPISALRRSQPVMLTSRPTGHSYIVAIRRAH